ncbi:unnamed protein product [Chrysoparadoxa australica]
MGVKGLWKVLMPCGRYVHLSTLEGKCVAVDVSIWLTQFVKAMRDAEGNPIRHAHLVGTMSRVIKLLMNRIRPVFVFDGQAPSLKRRTIQARQSLRHNAEHDHTKAAMRILAAQLKRRQKGGSGGASGRGGFVPALSVAERKALAAGTGESKGVASESNGDASEGRDLAAAAKHDKANGSNGSGGSDDDDAQWIPAGQDEGQGGALVTIRGSEDEGKQEGQASDDEGTDDEDGWEPVELPDNYEDIDLDAVAALPAELRKGVLEGAQRKQRMKSRSRYMTVAGNPQQYSSTQISNFLDSSKLNQKIVELQHKDAEPTAGNTIASDAGKRFVLTKDKARSPKSADLGIGNGIDRRKRKRAGSSPQSRAGAFSFLHNGKVGEQQPRLFAEGMPQPKAGMSMFSTGRWTMAKGDEDRDSAQRRRLSYDTTSSSSDSDGDDIGNSHVDGVTIKVEDSNLSTQEADMMFAELVQDKQATGPTVGPASVNQRGKSSTSEISLGDSYANCSGEEGVRDGREPPLGVKAPDTNKWKGKGKAKVAIEVVDISSSESGEGSGSKATSAKKAQLEADMRMAAELQAQEDAKPTGAAIAAASNSSQVERDAAMAAELQAMEQEQLEDVNVAVAEPKAQGGRPSPGQKAAMGETSSETQAVKQVMEVKGGSSATHVGAAATASKGMNCGGKQELGSASAPLHVSDVEFDLNDMAGADPEVASALFGISAQEARLLSRQGGESGEEDGTFASSSGDEDRSRMASNDNEAALQRAAGAAAHMADWAGRVMRRVLKENGVGVAASTSSTSTSSKRPAPSPAPKPRLAASSPAKAAVPASPAPAPAPAPAVASKTIGQSNENLGQANEGMDSAEEAELSKVEEEAKAAHKKAARDLDNVTDQMREEVMELLDAWGVPYLQAPMEAEAQCAELERLGLVQGVVSDDSDSFLFGSKYVYKNIFSDKLHVEAYHMSAIEEHYGWGTDELIALGLLLGTDYTDGVKGIGAVNGGEVLKAFPLLGKGPEYGLKKFRRWLDYPYPMEKRLDQLLQELAKEDQEVTGGTKAEYDAGLAQLRLFHRSHRNMRTKWSVGQAFPSPEVIKAYNSPQVDSNSEQFTWSKPNFERIKRIYMQQLGYTQAAADLALKEMVALDKNTRGQTKITNHFQYEHKLNVGTIRSKRLAAAVGQQADTPPKKKTTAASKSKTPQKSGTPKKKAVTPLSSGRKKKKSPSKSPSLLERWGKGAASTEPKSLANEMQDMAEAVLCEVKATPLVVARWVVLLWFTCIAARARD